ncbi:LOW QUALITY PROTEIN: MDIS1-interacting receptor like kinase 2 [Eucalyptus grandis]|uniref:LOW QUALITY PROTEIN: MDIS1-interacting receptor like kinase 2 n=1 Tax=Eucalyptus grandis TaxID=71139 RepID=UPI00192F1117|nr:LOW QUALITY PROTEIN: MDIS1-interacting receptor like kinase 2 [Eucalyptus grandis]
MNFSLLSNLTSLGLPDNRLVGVIPLQICALPKLRHLNLSRNYLTGELPLCLQNLTMLEVVDIHSNHIDSPIPPEVGNLKMLIHLDLSSNKLHGTIPPTLGLLSNLRLLNLSQNDLDGFIPLEIGNCVNLYHIDLEDNFFVGPIPSSVAKLRNLTHLYLGGNSFTCPIPLSLVYLTNLIVLDLHGNKFDCAIPLKIGDLYSLTHLDLSFNNFTSSIPSSIGNLTSLTHLYLQENKLGGSIPTEIGNLNNLRFLDLSSNNLVGKIPIELENLIPIFPSYFSPVSLNLSYNHLSGPIPEKLMAAFTPAAFLGNKDLTQFDETPAHRRFSVVFHMTVFIPLATIVSSCIVGSCFLIRRTKKSVQPKTTEKNGNFLSIWNYDGGIVGIAYEDIINATEDFDIKYCIGTGGYGSVYRARLPNGKVVALKKLHRLEAEDPSFDKSFRNEVKHLTKVRHRSIIKLHGFCLHRRCMFLVYEYMENGSLFCVLRDDVEAVELDWSKRINLVQDMAHALSYMHHDCAQPIVHRDISSNNILLNSKMQAFVSDFGTARLLNHDSSSNFTTNIGGTYGYIAPGEQYFILHKLFFPFFTLTVELNDIFEISSSMHINDL